MMLILGTYFYNKLGLTQAFLVNCLSWIFLLKISKSLPVSSIDVQANACEKQAKWEH